MCVPLLSCEMVSSADLKHLVKSQVSGQAWCPGTRTARGEALSRCWGGSLAPGLQKVPAWDTASASLRWLLGGGLPAGWGKSTWLVLASAQPLVDTPLPTSGSGVQFLMLLPALLTRQRATCAVPEELCCC